MSVGEVITSSIMSLDTDYKKTLEGLFKIYQETKNEFGNFFHQLVHDNDNLIKRIRYEFENHDEIYLKKAQESVNTLKNKKKKAKFRNKKKYNSLIKCEKRLIKMYEDAIKSNPSNKCYQYYLKSKSDQQLVSDRIRTYNSILNDFEKEMIYLINYFFQTILLEYNKSNKELIIDYLSKEQIIKN